MKKKKGMPPFIAAVILIAFVIAVAGIASTFFREDVYKIVQEPVFRTEYLTTPEDCEHAAWVCLETEEKETTVDAWAYCSEGFYVRKHIHPCETWDNDHYTYVDWGTEEAPGDARFYKEYKCKALDYGIDEEGRTTITETKCKRYALEGEVI